MKKFDVICIGRIAIDLYAQQIGSSLEQVSSFAKYLGDHPEILLTVQLGKS